MKKIIIAALFIFINNSVIFSQSLTSNITQSVDIQRYSLDLDLVQCFKPPYPNTFKGSEIISVKANGSINEIMLNAVNTSLNIISVGNAGMGFIHANNIVTISLDKTYNDGDIFDIKIIYEHKKVNDTAFFTGKGLLFTDCEPEGARKWFPCIDKPIDKATFQISAKVPAGTMFVSNGVLMDSIPSGDIVIYKWGTDYPLSTYLANITGKTDFILNIMDHTDNVNNRTIPVRYYYQKDVDVHVPDAIYKMKDVIEYYSKLFGPYPFEKIGFASLDRQFAWGGMENQTIITLCPNCWQLDLLAHEFGHQWFGDLISPSDWTDLWLNEGFATYCEALLAEHNDGPVGYRNNLRKILTEYLFRNPHTAVYNPEWRINLPPTSVLFDDAITYNKAGLIIAQFRALIGDEMFFKAIKAYTTSPEFMFKNISTERFITFMNEFTGEDYTWYWNEWLTQKNHPDYVVKYNTTGTKLEIELTQGGAPEIFFKMPVEIKVVFDDGTDKTEKVMNDLNIQTYTFNYNKSILKIIFDPQEKILLKKVTILKKG
ncbi:M1 family aminopeptidase [soil metagenome]